MDWIKVTPETMPTDMVPVMVTILQRFCKYDEGNLHYSPFVAGPYRRNRGEWEYRLSGCITETSDGEWGTIHQGTDEREIVTHWMPMPKPAED